MTYPFFTIGHSTRSLDAFVGLVRSADVELVVDIRRVTRSRTNPQFNEDVLADHLAASGLFYEHVAALGGLRAKVKDVSPDVDGFWENRSFHNYADYALSPPFQAGLQHLLEEGSRRRCTVMCAEAVWWRCHRRIVADYLLAAGWPVFHIMGAGRLVAAELTPGAITRTDSSVIYPGPSAHACGRADLEK